MIEVILSVNNTTMPIPLLDIEVPFIDTDQMIEVDRAMMDDYRISLIQMMENAGRCLAILTRERFLHNDAKGMPVTVLAGSGGNGGGALVAARRLHNWGANVCVVLAQAEEKMTPVPRQQLDILKQMGVNCSVATGKPHPDSSPTVIIDGLIGYSLKGAPRGVTRELIEWANEQAAPVLALDTPSGIDTATGTVFEPTIRATATMTLALPKQGLREPDAIHCVGELYLADISVPPGLYEKPGLSLEVGPIFSVSDVVRVNGFEYEG